MKDNKVFAYTGTEEMFPMEITPNLENLHTTLPMAELIGLFEGEVRDLVAYDSFEYEHPQKAIHFFKGSPKMHKCLYRLNADRIELGTITITRRHPFTEDEMLTVERAFGALTMHLMNAMDYQGTLTDEQLTSFRVDSELSRVK